MAADSRSKSIPSTMKAIKITETHTAEIEEVPVPRLREDYVLVKVRAVALNPTDWKHIDKIGKGGETAGVDLCGTIQSIGSAAAAVVPSSSPRCWKVGDRICAFVHGGNTSQHEDGAFGEYAVVKGGLGAHVPSHMSDAEAASLGTGIITCGQALYQSLGLPLPSSTADATGDNEKGKFWFLVYGASTATGTLAIQYAKLSGAKVVAICSERNFDLVRGLGAEEVFDYHDAEACADQVRAYTNDELELALDCIAEGESSKICEGSISSKKGGTVSYLLGGITHTRSDVQMKKTLGYTIMGEAFEKFGGQSPAKKEDFEHAKMFWELSERLLEQGKIKPHPLKVAEGGLEGVFDGLEQLRRGKVSGQKLVYRLGHLGDD